MLKVVQIKGKKFVNLRQNLKNLMVLIWGQSEHRFMKNLNSKISCNSPFKYIKLHANKYNPYLLFFPEKRRPRHRRSSSADSVEPVLLISWFLWQSWSADSPYYSCLDWFTQTFFCRQSDFLIVVNLHILLQRYSYNLSI